MAHQFDEQSTRYNAAQQAARANEGISVYDFCDEQSTKDFITKFTKEIRNILAPYEFIHHINDAIWLSHYIVDIREVLDGVSYDIYRSGAIKELSDRQKNETFKPFLQISLMTKKSNPYPLCMKDCIKTLNDILYTYQQNA